MRTLTITLVSVVALTGCFYPAERGKQLEARVDRLAADQKDLLASLQEQRKVLEAQIPKLDGQVEEVHKALELLDRASRRSGADFGVQLETLNADVSKLRGQVEQYVHQLNELNATLALLKEQQEKAPAGPAAGTPAAAGAATAGKDDGKKVEEKPADKKGQLEWVLQRISDEPDAGRKHAAEWLKKWSKDPGAPRLYLALGRSYVAQKDWRAALSEFGEIVKNFGTSPQAPDALLHSADCFAELKMKEEARLALEEVVNSYPKSDAAKTAKAKLAELKKPAKAAAPKKKDK